MKKEIFTLFLLLCLFATSITAQEDENEIEFDYREGSKKGPEHWGDLKKEWEECKNGEMQSPVDISNQTVTIIRDAEVLKRDYKPFNATLKNSGHAISVEWGSEGGAGSIEINGTNYLLRQAHWHSSSEHAINGMRYELELHMVHENEDPNAKNKYAVVALLYTIGQPDPFLSKLMCDVTALIKKKDERVIGVVDPVEIKMEGKRYYRYMGSLTTPPCTQGVIWTINQVVSTVSSEQVKLLQDAVYDYAKRNARPLQPLNQRSIQLYETPVHHSGDLPN